MTDRWTEAFTISPLLKQGDNKDPDKTVLI